MDTYPSLAKVADMYTKLNASRSYVYAVARACDKGKVSRRVSCWLHHCETDERINNPLGLCWSDPVLDGEGSRGRARRHAMPRRQWVHQW